ncbi:hypothetical protein D3C81_2153730 [compost metagenome]
MVDHQQQALAAAGKPAMQHPQQRAALQVEAALGALDGVFHGGAVGDFLLPQHRRLRRFLQAGVALGPAVRTRHEAQAQRIVAGQ